MPTLIEEHNLVVVSSDLRSNHVIVIRSPKVLASTKIEVMDLRDANPLHECNALARLYQSEGYG